MTVYISWIFDNEPSYVLQNLLFIYYLFDKKNHIQQHPSSPPSFRWVHVARSLVFCGVFCRSFFVALSFCFVRSSVICDF